MCMIFFIPGKKRGNLPINAEIGHKFLIQRRHVPFEVENNLKK